MTTEPNVCPHCGEEKPTPHVLVLKDDQYCEECWAELCSATYAEYYPKQLETVPLTSEVMMSDERMVMDKEQAAAFGQYVMDMIASHFADELRDIEMPTIDNEKMVDGYIRVWQRLKMENAALTAENAELRKVLGNLTQEVETWDACDKHNCANYRPVLPWPESEGWWWCSNGRLYEFVRHQGKFMAWWDDGDLTDSDLYSLHYPGEQAPRFTRLLEPNPFTK